MKFVTAPTTAMSNQNVFYWPACELLHVPVKGSVYLVGHHWHQLSGIELTPRVINGSVKELPTFTFEEELDDPPNYGDDYSSMRRPDADTIAYYSRPNLTVVESIEKRLLEHYYGPL